MRHLDFMTAVLSLSLSGGMLLGGPVLTDESQAIAAARRTVRRRRCGWPALGGRTTRRAAPDRMSDRIDGRRQGPQGARQRRARPVGKTSPSAAAVAGPSDAPAPARDPSNRERSAAPEKSPTAKAIEKAAAKSPPEGASNTKSTPEGTKLPDGAKSTTDGAASRNADPRPARQKRAARRDPTAASGAAPPTRPVSVTLEGPIFEGGDVPRAAAALDRMKGPFARCASIESALRKTKRRSSCGSWSARPAAQKASTSTSHAACRQMSFDV